MIHLRKKKLGWVLLFVLIALLWLIQWHALYYPYFWDEMGVYAYGVNYLIKHGISLFPEALPPEISRGHPLLIFGLYASILKIVGNSLFAAHSLALSISSLTLLACYRLARFFTPPIVAVLAALLLASLNIFLAQSTLVLPEMILALLTVLAFNSYFRKKYLWSILFLCLGVLVKESMIVTAGFIGSIYLVQAMVSGKLKQSLPSIFAFTAPLVVLILFLVIQRVQNGWYFFPYHTDLISEGVLAGFKEKLKDHLKFIFYAQGRFLWLPLLFFGFFSIFMSKYKKEMFVLVSFVGYTILLFSLAFYLDRYLLYLYPIICIIIVVGLFHFFQKRIYLFGIIGVLVLCSAWSWPEEAFNYDASLSYENVLVSHQNAVNDLCTTNEKVKVFANFPINMSLWEPFFGYIDEACYHKIVYLQTAKNADYLLLFNEHISEEQIFMEDTNFFLKKNYVNKTGTISLYFRAIPLKE